MRLTQTPTLCSSLPALKGELGSLTFTTVISVLCDLLVALKLGDPDLVTRGVDVVSAVPGFLLRVALGRTDHREQLRERKKRFSR